VPIATVAIAKLEMDPVAGTIERWPGRSDGQGRRGVHL